MRWLELAPARIDELCGHTSSLALHACHSHIASQSRFAQKKTFLKKNFCTCIYIYIYIYIIFSFLLLSLFILLSFFKVFLKKLFCFF